jgi:hypothetical protein
MYNRSEIAELRRQVNGLAEKYRSRAQGRLRQAGKTARENMRDVGQQIRSRPMLIVIGLGSLVGALLTRSPRWRPRARGRTGELVWRAIHICKRLFADYAKSVILSVMRYKIA